MSEGDLKEEKRSDSEPKQAAVLKEEPKFFKCEICNLLAKYSYYGSKPLERHNEPNTQTKTSRKEDITLLEKCFVCDDPFMEAKSKNFLVLGSRCNRCQKMVCVSNKCSLFYYTKRFCFKCAGEYIDEFPPELKAEISKSINP